MRSSQKFITYCILVTICIGTLLYLAPRPDATVQLRQYLNNLKREQELVIEEHDHVHTDEHMQMVDLSNYVRQTAYPKRANMGKCPKLFGKVLVFVAFVKSSMATHYRVAQKSLECYLKGTDYAVAMVDLDNDPRVQKYCNHKQLFFKKHCAASLYVQDADWMLVLDADSGIANPNHCIEEYIDDRVNLVFYERFFNWEIASGNYLARNSEFTVNFLRKWADWEFIQPKNWNGADNGVLQLHILQTVIPDATQDIANCDTIWHRGRDYDTYMAYVTCVKVALGATRVWHGKLRILRRGHGWVRDGFLTNDRWCENDFMFHGWKAQDVGISGWESPFEKVINPEECGNGVSGWTWREKKKANVSDIRKALSDFEKGAGRNFPKLARVHPYLFLPDVGECYPDCDKLT